MQSDITVQIKLKIEEPKNVLTVAYYLNLKRYNVLIEDNNIT